MSRVAVKIELSAEETDELNRWLRSGKTEQRKVERAKIVLRSAEGKPTHQIAMDLGTRPSTVSKWRKRFAKLRLNSNKGTKSLTRVFATFYDRRTFGNSAAPKLDLV